MWVQEDWPQRRCALAFMGDWGLLWANNQWITTTGNPTKHWYFICRPLWQRAKKDKGVDLCLPVLYFLIQVISETITTMKLAICPTWVEIFFDTTTQRQVPFLAVVISLMGDRPKSIDPIIVSLCIVLEDETPETQVDGIVSKVRATIVCSYWVTPQKTNHFSAKIIHFRKGCNEYTIYSCVIILRCVSPYHHLMVLTSRNLTSNIIMMDWCNAAQKARRLLQHLIGGEIFEIDCHHHL